MSHLLATAVVAFSLRGISPVYKVEAKSQEHKVKGLGHGNEKLGVNISSEVCYAPIGKENQKIATFYKSEFKAFVWRFSIVDEFYQVPRTQVRE